MGRFRILNAESENYSPDAAEILREVGGVTLSALDRDQLLRSLEGIDALIVRLGHRVDEAVFDAGPDLKAVVSATTGLDHIDMAAAQRRGVEVLSLKGEVDFLDQVYATSEHTWALLLALLRRIPRAHREASAGTWDRDGLKGRELAGRRLGLVGLGRIGRKVATYGKAFGMSVRAYDPSPERWVDGVDRVDSLLELAQDSDVLSVHVPLDDSTDSLIDNAVLQAMPEGAVLVNTSRGGIIDEGALLDALNSGRLAGAAVDVLRGEGTASLSSNPLLALAQTTDRLVVTPHIGGATFESMAKTEIFMAHKLVGFLSAM